MRVDFDIEYAKLAIETRLGWVVTRSGFRVTIITWTCPLNDHPIAGYLAGGTTHYSWNKDGKWYCNGLEHPNDLFVEISDEIWTA
jgi:hypothetical protein